MTNVLHLENDNLTLGGVNKIVSSSPTQAVVEGDNGQIVINGQEIEVKNLNLDDKQVVFYGKFSKITFGSEKKQPFLKRIFK